MATAFFASVGFTPASTGTAVSITLPGSIPANTVGILVLSNNSGSDTLTQPTNNGVAWESRGSGSPGSTNISYLFSKNLGPADSGTDITASWSGSGKMSGGVVLISGGQWDTVSTVQVDNTTDTSITFNSVTPTAADALLVAVAAGQHPSTTGIASWTASWTQRLAAFGTAALPVTSAVFYTKQLVGGPSAQAGAPGLWSQVSRDVTWQVSIRPGVAPLTGSGAIAATAATLSGSGTVTSLPPVTGTGSLTASAATLSGSGAVKTTRTNLVLDPDTTAPTNGTYWFATGATRSASGGNLRATATGTTIRVFPTLGGPGALGGANYTVSSTFPADVISASVVASSPFALTFNLLFTWYDADSNILGTSSSSSVAASSTPITLTHTDTAIENATSVNISFNAAGAAVGNTVDLTDFLVSHNNSNTGYFSGASTDTANVDYSWTGTANQSTSTAVETLGLTVTGTGSLSATSATLSGSGTVSAPVGVTGTAVLVAAAAVLAGSGALGITGTGNLTAPAATLSGSGTSRLTGTGALTAPAATLSGSGTVPLPVSGDGDLAGPQATLSGSGTLHLTGTGDLEAAPATLTGSGTGTLTGSGDLYATAPTLTGTATLTITGSGQLTANPGQLAATGSVSVNEPAGPTPASRTYTVPAESRVYVVAAEARTVIVAAEHREITA